MDLETYEKTGRPAYAALADTIAGILGAAIAQRDDIKLQHIQKRAKDPVSLKRKLKKAGVPADAEIESGAKDLAGVRIVLYTNSDVTQLIASQLIPENFDVDWDRTKIHHPSGDSKEDEGFFVSNNYVVKLKHERAVLPEYTDCADMWCEVQVQTTLNHAWSEMAHDTIYKKPELDGFGGTLLDGIERRLRDIMIKYLRPAGYEFQKVVADAERLASGKELFDRGVLTAIDASADNNERHDVLERFATHVLPYYDDYGSVSAEVLETVTRAVAQARETPDRRIDTPYGSMPGHTAYWIANLAAKIIDELRRRYLNPDAMFDALVELYEGAEDPEEHKLWLESVEALSKHDLRVWEVAGPCVQSILVERIGSLPFDRIVALHPLVLTVLRQVLSCEVSGTSSPTHDTIAIRRGSVIPSEELARTRVAAIGILMRLFEADSRSEPRSEILHALDSACATG